MTALARSRDERGGAVLEFVIVLPVALAVIGLVLGAGWLGLVRVIVDHGARSGARAAAVPVSADLRGYATADGVRAAVDDAMPLLSPTTVTVVGVAVRNAPVEVEVTYTFTNPFAILLAPVEALGIGDPVPDTLTVTGRGLGRRE